MRNLHIDPHLEPSRLILYKGLDKSVKLFRFVGDIESEAFDRVKEYFYYITPDFALNERLIGFDDYDDIGYYCQENDVWMVEEILDTPIELTIGYEKQILKDEKDRRERQVLDYIRQQKKAIAEIDEAFIDATYPQRRHDHLLDLIHSSRVYVPDGRNFFSEYGVMYILRENHDYMARISNSRFDNDLCNTTGVVRGVYCYTKYKPSIARLINSICVDETEEFRRLYSKHIHFKGIPHPKDPHMPSFHHHKHHHDSCNHHHHYHPVEYKEHDHVDCKFDKKDGLY